MCKANGYRVGLSLVLQYHSDDLEKGQRLAHRESFDKGLKTGSLALGKSPKLHYRPVTGDLLTHPNELGDWVRDIAIEPKSFGETYHLAVAKLLSPGNVAIVLKKADEAQQGAKQATDFLQFYGFHHTMVSGDGKSAANVATDIIRTFFDKHFANQELVFTFIRQSLERSPLYDKIKDLSTAKPGVPHTRLSALGRYYVGRFLALTQQKDIFASGHSTNSTGKTVLLYVRRGGLDRNMGSNNLHVCLKAIIAAGQTTPLDQEPQRLFERIILFGDFHFYKEDMPNDGKKGGNKGDQHAEKFVKSDAERFLRSEKILPKGAKAPEIIAISQPWAANEKDRADGKMDPIFRATQNFWAEYRRDSLPFSTDHSTSKTATKEEVGPCFRDILEGAPLQAKNLAIFLALQAHYGDDLCSIGFRSGFLDAAAFIGTPTFYIDQTLYDHEVREEGRPEQLLWTRKLVQDRMALASDDINSFIRLDIQAKQKWDLNAVYDIPKLPGQTGPKPKPASIGSRLSAALYTYMLAGKEGEKPCWTRKVEMFNGYPEKGPAEQASDAERYARHALSELSEKL
jgi:hypothetical protein